MVSSFSGLALRQVRVRRLRAALTAFGIVLGVGMVFGVLLLSGTIRHTFDDIIDSAWGSKDLIVTPRGGTLPQGDLAAVQATPGVRDAGAMVGGVVVRLNRSGRPIHGAAGRIRVAGYDTTAQPPFDFEWVAGRPPRSGPELTVERNWARDHGVQVGDRLALGSGSGRLQLPVVGIFKFANGLNFGGEGLGAMPVEAARQIFGVPRGWHQISLRAADRSQIAEVRRTLQQRLGAGVRVDTPTGYGDQIKGQLDALNVILYFFAGVALFVGGFLILNSFSMTVAQRIRELGMLRTLGASRRMIRRSVMTEAALLGLVGSLFGLALGLGLAAGLIVLIRGFGIPVESVHVSPGAAVIALLLGLVATASGAWWPSRRAARVPAIQAAQGVTTARSRLSKRRLLAGAALFLPGMLFGGSFWFSNASSGGASAILGVAMTMAMFAGMALAAPMIIAPLVRLLSAPLRRLAPTGGRLAADAARRNPSRTAATAIALTIGLSVVVVNGAIAASFIGAVNDRIDRTYARDVTVRPVGATTADGGSRSIGADARRAIAALPDAGVVSPLRYTLAELPGLEKSPNRYGLVEGVDPATIGAVDRGGADGIAASAVPAALARGEALVARGYAEERGLHVGDRFTLSGPRGHRTMRVAGINDVFNDFGGNNIRVSAAVLNQVFGVTTDAELLVRASSPGRREALARSVDRLLERRFPELESLSTAQVKHDIGQEIDRQFALFNAILAIAVIVSLLGVVNTLAMSVVERTREIGVLRALGSSRWLIRMTMVHEGLLITVSGAIAGLALGSLIAFVWVQSLDRLVPNLVFRVPTGLVLAVAVAAVVLGTLAAVLPARRAARLDVVDALAYE